MRNPPVPAYLFLKAILKDWWGWMSCAAFTFLGIWAAAAGKSGAWVLWASFVLGVAFFFVATYRAWVREHEIVVALMETPNVTISVHGIFSHVAVGRRLLVIVPDVSIANHSHGLGVALTVDLWMLRSGGMQCWCAGACQAL